MGAVLTLMMYFTSAQIANGTPEVTIMQFDTYAECEFYIEKNKPAIERELQDGLLGYSAKCEVN
jgi:predicted nucleotidyltransferase